MKYKKFAATALLAVAATGVTAGTSYADPSVPPAAQEQAPPAARGVDKGVDYTAALTEAGNAIVTTVTGGAFSLDADGSAVTLINDAGEVVTRIPLAARDAANGAEVRLVAAVDDAGRSLTLTPQAEVVAVKDISAQQWFFAELQRASLGAAVGAVIGGLIGLLGLVVGVIPGAAIGAVIGLLVAGGPALIDSGIAYFSGQP
ncbi:hypothetical protein [Nocardia farcinica]|uniref:hypothetical protein n=1 Tax=Nocardia farcinica TaxID=37329 RepID=UPI000BF746C9|nr:hypothetical protein [Nocardia farcinica]MBA4856387.1 hypothetical protein [Nocardia farcinica]MBC9814213.1 hypothetical protein [Nocardia farcinica]PFX03340.1 hypothetical protein CJ469_01214 [Nocardia farcinica]PFX06916.1 hypothetical protein CJ468_04124 [Nocardia farcinica]